MLPVLKHGPRSEQLSRVFGLEAQARNESERRWDPGPRHGRTIGRSRSCACTDNRFEQERQFFDPKDGELKVIRAKTIEMSLEARRDVDVQITL